MSDADDDDEMEHEGTAAPDKEPKSATAWLATIEETERLFKDYQTKADNIDKLYADLDRLSKGVREREFQLFWANIQVLGPSIYSRPPVPVVVPRFKDRRALPRVTSELLERSTIVMFELQDVDAVMRLIRDDLTILSRGCVWLRYEADGKGKDFTEKVCIEYKDRKDFLHHPARTWNEVDWVDGISYLSKKEMRKRFFKSSGDAYKSATYEERKDDETDDGKLKARVHEIWCKSQNRVYWVADGCDKILDEDKPHLKLDGFYPCPRPAYATVQRRSLIPIPDMLFYKDQLEEINELTGRIAALADAVKVRGFYPAGAGEIGDAIEHAIKENTNNQVLIPVSNWAMVGAGGVKDMIVWLPLDMIAATIVQLVELRKQLIDDVYQIMGLSDIMRGSTDSNETLGAQELKSQYGSVRIRDKQDELVRVARDIVRISAEIMAENFQPKTLLDMSQLEIPSDADIAKQVQGIEAQIMQIIQQVEQAKADPQMVQQAQQNPEQAKQMLAQAEQQAMQLKGQITKLQEQPTIEKVVAFLRDQRLRPFVLDIETDSTIAPDENATKQRATEFITAVGGFMREALPLAQTVPQAAPLMGETLKFVSSQFRAGRQLEQAIEEFADQMKQQAQQPKPDPEAIKAEAEAKAAEADAAERQANSQRSLIEAQSQAEKEKQDRAIRAQEAQDAAAERALTLQAKRQLAEQEYRNKDQKHIQDMDIGSEQLRKLSLEIERIGVQTEATIATTGAKINQANTQTENAIKTTDAGVAAIEAKTSAGIEASRAGVEIKREAAMSKEPA